MRIPIGIVRKSIIIPHLRYIKANLRPLAIRRPLRNGGVWKSSREAQISTAEGGARKAMWNYWLLPKIYQM